MRTLPVDYDSYTFNLVQLLVAASKRSAVVPLARSV
jgi:anthranilate/para-aminobenzoate synthase component II